MNISVFPRSVTAVALLATSSFALAAVLPPAGVATDAFSAYDGVVAGPNPDTAGDPGNANSSAVAGPGGDTFEVVGYGMLQDESRGAARASLPGTVGAFAAAGGFSPGLEGVTDAFGGARQVTHWQAKSTVGGAVGIDVAAFFDGTLITVDYANTPNIHSSINVELNAHTSGGVVSVFSATATLHDTTGLAASGNWAGAWTQQETGSIKHYSLDFFEFIDDAFFVNAGETFAWEVIMEADAVVDGPFETHALADFLNTGSGDLSTDTPGATLAQVSAVVPVPAALWLFAGGLAGLLTRVRFRRV